MNTDTYTVNGSRLATVVLALAKDGTVSIVEAIAIFKAVASVANERPIDGTWTEECQALLKDTRTMNTDYVRAMADEYEYGAAIEHSDHQLSCREICAQFAHDAIFEPGVNWAHAKFDNETTARAFESAMTENGYETRGVSAPFNNGNPNLLWWRVQFR